MPLPLRPAPDRPHAWARGEYLPLPTREWVVEGFPGFTVDETGKVWRSAFVDASNHRRKRKEIKRACISGCFGFWLRKPGVSVWVGIKQMKALRRRA